MSTTKPTPAEWGERYRQLYETYSGLATRLEHLLADLLSRAGIDVVQIECRAKTVDSFVEKLARKNEKYTSPLDDVTDLIGIRVITYYLEDVDTVGQVIADEFSIDPENTIDKTRALDPKTLGYLGRHYVVSLGQTRKDLPEWADFSGKRAEIQVRTAAQHAWAAVDHKLNYKSPHEIPDQLRRNFYLLSALFELADTQFSRLRQEHEQLAQSYSDSVQEGDFTLAIDSASLEAYLERSTSVETVRTVARELGWTEPAASDDPGRAARDRQDLLATLKASGLTTIKQFDELLASEEGVRTVLTTLQTELGDEDNNNDDLIDDLLTQILMVLIATPPDLVHSIYRNPSAAESILRARAIYQSTL